MGARFGGAGFRCVAFQTSSCHCEKINVDHVMINVDYVMINVDLVMMKCWSHFL